MPKTNKNPLESTLVKAGLSSEEAEIYLDLLEHGAETASQVAAHTTVKRTYVYKLVEGLIEKGLVREKKEGRTTLFEPNSPDHLLGLVEAKKHELSSAERELEAALSSLKDKYSSVDSKPLFQVFEGVEGIKKIYNDTLKEEKDILALLEASPHESPLKVWMKEKYVPERVKLGIHAKVILATNEYAKDYISRNEKSLRTVKQVDNKKYPLKNEVNIYGDKVAFLKAEKDGVAIGFILEHKQIAQTMKAWFDLVWEKI